MLKHGACWYGMHVITRTGKELPIMISHVLVHSAAGVMIA